jgi:hypothetical protein
MIRAGSASDPGSCYAINLSTTDLSAPTSLHARVPVDAKPGVRLDPCSLALAAPITLPFYIG